MCECQVHEAVFVEVECDDARGIRLESRVPGLRRSERSFAWIRVDGRGRTRTGEHKIDRSIVIQIGCKRPGTALAIPTQSGLDCPIRECSIAVIAPQRI